MSKYALVKAAAAYVLAEEPAREQLMDLLGYYDVDVARVKTDTEDGKKAVEMLERALDHLVEFIRLGKLEIRRDKDGKLEVVHNLERGEQVVYTELSAKAKLAMDRAPVDARYTRMYQLMGSLSSLGLEGIQRFHPRDLAVVETLGPVFMTA